jgi:hypothetical protein
VSRKYYFIVIAIVALAVLPAIAYGCPLGNARLVDVTPVTGGCAAGPTGPQIQYWDLEPGHAYTLTITNVTECAGGGTDPTLNVRVNSWTTGNTDLIATYVSPGVYKFDYWFPRTAVCTFRIFYCTTPGISSSGRFVIRNDGVVYQALLRASRFEAVGMGCTNPVPIDAPECGGVLGTGDSSWGAIKGTYK